jgi:Secretion system C-terminal sorting domain
MIKRILMSVFATLMFQLAIAQSITSNSPLCVDSRPTLQLKASGGTIYQWSGPNNFFSNDQNPTITNASYVNAGNYTCVIDGKTTLTLFAKIGKLDGLWYISSNVNGAKLSLNAYSSYGYSGSGFTFNWTGPNGFVSNSQYNTLSEINKKMEGFYTINVKDEYGCNYNSTSGQVKFNNSDCPYLPIIYVESATSSNGWSNSGQGNINIDVCEGTNLTFRTDTTGWGKSSIQWYKDDKIIPNATGLMTLTKAEGAYYANIKKGDCSYNTYKIVVKYNSNFTPLIVYSPIADVLKTERVICKNEGYTIFNFSGYDRAFHANTEIKQWYKDGVPVEGSNQNSLKATDAGVYQLKVKRGQCEGLSYPVTVKKADKIETKFYFDNYTLNTKTLKVCSENQQSIYIYTEGSGEKKIFKNGQLFSNIQDNGYINSFNITQQSGMYVMQTSQGGCTAYDTLRLEYGKTNSLPIQGGNYFLSCSNPSSPYFYVSNFAGTISNYTRWERDGTLFNVGSSYIYPNNSNGVYQAKYDNPNTGCMGVSEKVVVNIPANPSKQIIKIVNSPKKIKLCKNLKASAVLQINNAYSNATWKKDGKIYDTGNSSSAIVTEAGKYWYEYNAGSCVIYSDTVEVTVEEIPKITLTQNCNSAKNTVKLSATKLAGVQYNWFKNGAVLKDIKDTIFTTAQSGNYQVEISQNGCYATSNELNLGVIIPETNTICNGDSLTLKSTGDLQQSYAWTGPNNFKSNLQDVVLNKTSKKNQGQYSVQATDKNGCSFKTLTNVVINDYPAFILPKTFTACAGTDFEFTNIYPPSLTDSTETIGSFYVISPSQNISNQSPYLNSVSAKDAGIYNFVIYPSQGYCFAKATTQLIVDASSNCKNIVVDNTVNVNKCADSPLSIPFKITGNFTSGATFKAFYEQLVTTTDGTKMQKIIVGYGQKSPIIMDAKKLSPGYSYFIKVEAEDGTVSKGKYFSTKYPDYNAIVEAQSFNRFNDCSSLSLRLNNTVRFGTKLQWFLEGDTLKNANTLNFTATKSGTYSVKTLDTAGCVSTFSQKISIGKLDKPIINSYSSVYGKDLNVSEIGCFSGDLSLSTNYYSNVKYTWKRNGIPQTSNYTGILTKLGGKYTVEIEQASCKAVSDTFTVTVNPNKKVSLIAAQYGNDTLSAYISVTGLNTTNNNIYQIFKENTLFAEGTNGATYVKESGKYFYKVVDGDCEAISNILDVKLIAPFSSGAKMFLNGQSNSIAEVCDSISIKNITGTSPYAYSTKQVAKRKYTATRNGVVLPTFTTDDGIYTSAKLVNYNQYFYLYFTKLGKYKVVEEVTFIDSTKAVARFDSIVVSLGSPVKLGNQVMTNFVSCNDSLFIYGENNYLNQRPVAYTWKKDGVVFRKTAAVNNGNLLVAKTSGLYVLETTYKGGCIAISSPQKVEIGNIKILTDTSAKILCDGAILPLRINTLLGTLSDTTKIYTQWQKDGKDYIKLTDNNPYNTIIAKESGIYTVKVQQGKCQSISPAIVVKSDKIPNSINISDSTQFCKGNILTLKTNDESTLSYLWERNGNFMVNATKASLDTKQDGTYRALNRRGSCWNYTPTAKAKLLDNILPTAIITGDKEINYADTAKVSIAFTSYSPWTFKLSDGKEYTATKSPFVVSLRPQFSTNYTLTEVKNVCGTGIISGTANIKVLILSSEQEEGINLNVFPVPSKEDVNIQLVLDKPEAMEWTLNNTLGNILQTEIQANKSTKHESNVLLKSLPEGVYFLRIQVGEKSLIRKIIKTN